MALNTWPAQGETEVTMSTRTICIAPFILVFVTTALAAQPKQTSLPGLLEPYVTNVVKLTPMQRKQLFAGEPVTQMLDAGSVPGGVRVRRDLGEGADRSLSRRRARHRAVRE